MQVVRKKDRAPPLSFCFPPPFERHSCVEGDHEPGNRRGAVVTPVWEGLHREGSCERRRPEMDARGWPFEGERRLTAHPEACGALIPPKRSADKAGPVAGPRRRGEAGGRQDQAGSLPEATGVNAGGVGRNRPSHYLRLSDDHKALKILSPDGTARGGGGGGGSDANHSPRRTAALTDKAHTHTSAGHPAP